MLDGLLGRGFSSKCKSKIKHIKARIEVIKKKRNAMQKFLKKDIADLLTNGLDINAFGRADRLIDDLNRSSCYDLVEQYCVCISKQLSIMEKQRECPEECREAVPSLMFAAARFADLPELRKLRHIFVGRYGNSLESFVNLEFVEKLDSKPPMMDKKIKLMRDIAQEFSVEWDSKVFEQKMSIPALPGQDGPKIHESFHDTDNGYKLHNSRKDTVSRRENQDVPSYGRREFIDYGYKPHNGRADIHDVLTCGRQELTDDGYILHSGREDPVPERDGQHISSRGWQELTGDGCKPRSDREDTLLRRECHDISSRQRQNITDGGYKMKRDNLDPLSHGRRECINDGFKLHNGREDTVPERTDGNISSHGRPGVTPSRTTKQVKTDSKNILVIGNNPGPQNLLINAVFEEDREISMPFYKSVIPPPYVKQKTVKLGTSSEARHTSSDYNEATMDPPTHSRDITKNRSEKTRTRSDHGEYKRQVVGPSRVIIGHGDEMDHHYQDDLIGDAKSKPKTKPKQRSGRRKHLKSPSGYDNIDQFEDGVVKRKPSGRRREDARPGDDNYEEKMMDKMLIHYSKKQSTYKPNNTSSHHIAAATGELPHNGSSDKVRLKKESSHPPARAVSLRPEPTTPTEVGRGPARVSSFQPDMVNPDVHVLSRLPNDDDLAARFAALRGR